ncbi:hypothetical protein IH86_15105 [Sphingobium yanoikuyae]|nr:hypothetical protein IH86_15105 [Sphingobium yanoikuyae]
MASLLLATTALGAGAIVATPALAQDVRSYDIPAGPLADVLNQYARQAGVELAYHAELTGSASSLGLKGSFGLAEGLSHILSGTGITYRQTGPRAFTLEPAPTADAGTVQLGPVRVEGSGQGVADNDIPTPKTDRAATERSHSYAARAATIAGKVPQPLQDIPNSVSVVTRQRIEDQNMVTLADALRYTPGVLSATYPQDGYYTARGYQLGIEFDSVALLSGIQYVPQLDLAFYDRIEVFRGPAGVMQGIGNPGGTVNMVRKRPLEDFKLSTETQVTSFGGARQSVDVTGPLDKSGALRGRVVVVGLDEDQSIHRYNKKEGGAYGILEYDLDPNTTASLSAAYQINYEKAFDYGVGGMSNGARLPTSWSQNFAPDWNYGRFVSSEVNFNLLHNFDNGWKSNTTVLYSHKYLRGTDAYPWGATGTDPYQQDYIAENMRQHYDWFAADTNVSGPLHLLGQDHTLTFGANYTQFYETVDYGSQDIGTWNVLDAKHIPEPADISMNRSHYKYTEWGIYGQAHIQIAEPFSLTLGGRGAWYESATRNTGAWSTNSRISGKFIPYAAAVYKVVPTLSAYVSYSTVFAPQTDHTYTNQALPPASGKQYEAGLKGTFLNGRLNASGAWFRIDNDHYSISDPLHTGFSIDSGKVRSQGWDFEVSGEPVPNWNVFAAYSRLKTVFLNGGASTGASYDLEEPRNLFKLWTTYRFQQGAMRGWLIGGGVYAQSATSRLAAIYKQPAYAVFNSQVGYQINKNINASLSLNNMFDKKYYSRTPGSVFGAFGDRRNVMLTVRTSFGK